MDGQRLSGRRISTHAPAGGATCRTIGEFPKLSHFYSRPCGRGDVEQEGVTMEVKIISTHAPAGGATMFMVTPHAQRGFLLTPLREGRPDLPDYIKFCTHFYSRPCGRGDHEE